MFVKPRIETDTLMVFKPFGYYIDEYGIKRKGIIPDKNSNIIPNYTWNDPYIDERRIKTSNPNDYI